MPINKKYSRFYAIYYKDDRWELCKLESAVEFDHERARRIMGLHNLTHNSEKILSLPVDKAERAVKKGFTLHTLKIE